MPDVQQNHRRESVLIVLGALILFLVLATPRLPDEDSDKHALSSLSELGEVRIGVPARRQMPTPLGLDRELARTLADTLNLELSLSPSSHDRQMLGLIGVGSLDIGSWGMTRVAQSQEGLQWAPAYRSATFQLVHRRGTPRPADLTRIDGEPIHITGSAEMSAIRQILSSTHPQIRWVVHDGLNSENLLEFVLERSAQYAILRSDRVAYYRRFYPEAQVAFDATGSFPVSWPLRTGLDQDLDDAVRWFFARIKDDGTLDQLIDRYYGHLDTLDYVTLRRFRRHIQERLPRFQAFLEEAAKEVGEDWHLLAAMAYQESQWDPEAVSPTGVKGLMMLTRATAKQMGIEDRRDPESSIMGGARYLHVVKKKIPERIVEPDRTWLALAAYNVGFGHLEDARILTQRAGKNPDRWNEVKEHLPLLSQEDWYRRTKHGFARGGEPVQYVERIRNFNEVLTWLTARQETDRDTATATTDLQPAREGSEIAAPRPAG